MDVFALLGYLAICAFYPIQLWRIFYMREVGGLSITALWALVVGLSLLQISMVFFGGYFIYAVGNGISLLCGIAMIQGYYLYKRRVPHHIVPWFRREHIRK